MKTSIQKCFLVLVLVLQAGIENANADDSLTVGNKAHYYLNAHFATGCWADDGKDLRCPILNQVEQTKVVIYAKEASQATMRLASALDKMMKQFPQLKYSFLVVSNQDRKEAMTDAELAKNLQELAGLGEQFKIEQLSMGYLQYSDATTRWRNSLKFFGESDVVLVVIEPGIAGPRHNEIRERRLPLQTVKPYYRFAKRVDSAGINDEKAADDLIWDALSSLAR